MSDALGIIARELKVEPEKLAPETGLADIASWDSLKHMDLIAALEDELAVEFTGDEIADMLTVGAILETVERHRAG